MSDTHVGFAAYSRVGPDGLNQREQDFFEAFHRAVDVAIGRRVDAVVHSGDVFDSVRPTNRAIGHVLGELSRLHAAGIPSVVIGGNHEAPRLRETGAVLRLLEFIPGVRAVYRGRYEPVRIGDLAVHAVPHAESPEALREELARVAPDPAARFNVATLHAGVLGVADFRTGEFHEQTVAQNEIPAGMDYVALGHYHRAVEVAPRVWYAGSTERCTFREAGETKSVNLADLAAGTVEPIPLLSRPMLDLAPVEAGGLTDAQVGPAIQARIREAELEGAIARLRVRAVPAHVYAALDHRRLREATAAALHFDLDVEIVRREAEGSRVEAIGELAAEFEAYLRERPLSGGDRDALLAAATGLLRAAVAREAA